MKEKEKTDGGRSRLPPLFSCYVFSQNTLSEITPPFCPVFFKSGFVLGEKETHTHKKVLAYSLPCFRITHYFTSKTHFLTCTSTRSGHEGHFNMRGKGKGGERGEQQQMMNSLLGVPPFHAWKEEEEKKEEEIKMRRKVSEKHCVSFKDIQPDFLLPFVFDSPLQISLLVPAFVSLSVSFSPLFPRVLYTR